MGFYLKKSFKFGPMRINLSKSGIGTSFGIKGLRIGSGPRGNYMHTGRYGLYYRKKLNDNFMNMKANQVTQQENCQANIYYDNLEVVDKSLKSFVYHINTKINYMNIHKIVFVCGLILSFFTGSIVLALFTLVMSIAAFMYDKQRKTSYLFFVNDKNNRQKNSKKIKLFYRLQALLTKASLQSSIWYVSSLDNNIIKIKAITGTCNPAYITSDITPQFIKVNNYKLFFYPDRILIINNYTNNIVCAVKYNDLQISFENLKFVDTDDIPIDANIIGYTWEYTTKNGSPDKRHKNNRKVPIVSYGHLSINNSIGFDEHFIVSNITICKKIAETLKMLIKEK